MSSQSPYVAKLGLFVLGVLRCPQRLSFSNLLLPSNALSRCDFHDSRILEGKNAIVTGSTSGIGLEVAKKLASQGANITLNGFGNKSDIDAAVKKVRAFSSPSIIPRGRRLGI